MGYIIFGVIAAVLLVFFINVKKGNANALVVKEKALTEYLLCKNLIKNWHKDSNAVITDQIVDCVNLVRNSEKRIVFDRLYEVKTSNDAYQFVYAKEIYNLLTIDRDIRIGDLEFIEALLALEKKLSSHPILNY